ncbi:MAG: hypothetical protein ACREL7_13815 [Longimicrobiales bacterium]
MIVALLAFLACTSDATAPRTETVHLSFDVGRLTGTALGDAASVLARITVSISLLNQDVNVYSGDFQLTPVDSMLTIEVDVSPGPYSIAINAFSNNGTTIYFLATTVFLGEDSPVDLTLGATNAVLVVGPVDAGLSEPLIARNAGITSLIWTAGCGTAQTGGCDSMLASPTRGTLPPGASDTIRVCTATGQNDLYNVIFQSGVGTVTVRKAARPFVPGTNQLLC